MTENVFFATAPNGIELLLAAELATLGALEPKVGRSGVSFRGSLELAYRICLWSRTASRILLPLAEFTADNADDIYEGIHHLPWEEHLAANGTLSVEFIGSGTGIHHSHFGAQRVKDAIVDRFRARCGQRPNVDRQQPDLRLQVLWRNNLVKVGLDLSGDSLHRRGYRAATVIAPLKETLAAALLLKAGWSDIAAAGGALIDPLCGSGTFAIEAAWIATDRAPGLLREHWGFSGWLGHIPVQWQRLLGEAQERSEAGRAQVPPIFASDHDPRAVRATWANAERAEVADLIEVKRAGLIAAKPPADSSGLLITNPPYGERIGEQDELVTLYAQLGDQLKSHFQGWQAAMITGNPELGKRMGLRAHKNNVFYNGSLKCQLLQFHVQPEFFVDREAADRRAQNSVLERATAAGAGDFINRLRKNMRHLNRWAERENVHCYRLYDADLPDYAVAIDRYEQWLHVQEYAPPSQIDPERALARLEQVKAVLPTLLDVPPENVFVKVRQRQKGNRQYQKQAEDGRFHKVREGAAQFWVNFSDYLDTGLFLDHRITRQRLGELAEGRRFLNLFGYTGAATVHAALGEACYTTTVDLSATYLDWAKRNLALNGIDGSQHQFVRADCQAWLAETREQFDLIFLDPPTFSNSKRLSDSFELQRDHVELLQQSLRLLAPYGVLIFSTNHRKFRLDQTAFTDWQIEDWSRRTLPPDFARNPKIHRCWHFQRS